MTSSIRLFVVDTGPLITLAAADCLDYLLYVDARIVIPDAVLYEATYDAAKLGAQDIIDWVKIHRALVEIAPTRAYVVFEAARAAVAGLREPGLGERAAIEVVEQPNRLLGDEKAVLLCEESAVLRRIVVRDRARIVELTTMDFLRVLEAERRIQSAEHVFETARQAGRDPSRIEKLGGHSPDIRATIAALVSRDAEG